MQSVRNKFEYPGAADVIGTTRFDGQLMRAVVIKNGQVAQIVDLGNVTAVTATYTVLPSDGIVKLGNTTSYTATLPAITAVPKGWGVTFKKTGASGVNTIAAAGSDTIDGAASITLTGQFEAVRVFSDGTNWVKSGNTTSYLVKQTIGAGASQTVNDATDIVVITSDTAIALTLPAAATKSGKILRFKKNAGAGTAATTLTRAGADTIDGGTTYTITADKRVTELYSDGTAWFITVPSGLAMTAG